MPDSTIKSELKDILRDAQVEVALAVKRIDSASDAELAALAGAAHNLAAFVDFNGSCPGDRGKLKESLAAFVDFNDSCGSLANPGTQGAFVDFNSSCGSLTRTSGLLKNFSRR